MNRDRTDAGPQGPTPDHAGGARLVLAVSTSRPPAGGRVVTPLERPVTTIGSAPDCDLVLDGLAPRHAEVRRDERDEFRLVAHQPHVRVHGNHDKPGLLRTGARIELGDWELVYYRE